MKLRPVQSTNKTANDMGSEKINTGPSKSINSDNNLNHLNKVSTPDSIREELSNHENG